MPKYEKQLEEVESELKEKAKIFYMICKMVFFNRFR